MQAFDTRFGRVGMLICEDFWHASPPYLLWLDGADLFLFTSASPGRGLSAEPQLGTSRWVEAHQPGLCRLFTSFVVHTNRVGFEDGLNFWGGSTVFDPNGELVCQAPYHEEALTIAELDLNQLHRTRARLPLLRDERTALVQRELNRILSQPNNQSYRQDDMIDLTINTDLARNILTGFIRTEITRAGLKRAVIGLSGGIDSRRLLLPGGRSAGAGERAGGAHALQDLLGGFAGACPAGDRCHWGAVPDHPDHARWPTRSSSSSRTWTRRARATSWPACA